MYMQVSFYDFCDAFKGTDRESSFSYNGKRVLFDYLEEREAENGVPYEFNAVAIDCEWTESTWQEINEDYSLVDDEEKEGLDGDEFAELVRERLQDKTYIAGEVPGGCVYQDF